MAGSAGRVEGGGRGGGKDRGVAGRAGPRWGEGVGRDCAGGRGRCRGSKNPVYKFFYVSINKHLVFFFFARNNLKIFCRKKFLQKYFLSKVFKKPMKKKFNQTPNISNHVRN